MLAREFANEGANLVLCARDEEELERARADLIVGGAQNVLTIVCDVTSRAEVESLAPSVLARFGRIDVLVNRTLPAATGADSIGAQAAKGFESETAWTTSPLAALTDQAARDNNEMG